MDASTDYFETIGRLDPFDLLDLPSWLPRVTRMRSRKSLAFFDSAVAAILAPQEGTAGG